MSKQVLFKKKALNKILKGLDITADAVISTLGPKGRNVMLSDSILPHITNDGHTVANSISLEDPFEDLGCWLVKNTCAQTNEDVGDATTTTAALLKKAVHKSLKRNESPVMIKNSLQEACKKVVEKLKDLSKPIELEDIRKVALISSENEEIADIVSEVITKVGKEGVVVVEESRTYQTSYEIQEGYELNAGFTSPYFANDKTSTKAEYENIPVLCSQKKISTIQDIKPLFDQLDAVKKSEIVIVCEDIDPQILGVLVMNKLQGRLGIVVIKTIGTQLEDIAAITGATLISDTTGVGFDKIDINKHLGLADKFTCTEKKSLFVAKTPEGEALANRLKEQVLIINNQFEKEAITKRIAKLTGGIAVIKIGAITDLDRVYKKDKTDDTVAAVKAALAEGVVEGGGMALWRIAKEMKPKTVGEKILKKVLKFPLKQLCKNAGKNYWKIIWNMPKGMGYDAKNDKYVNMIESDIIDPTKAERVALENAISNTSVFITTTAAICENLKK